MRRTAVVFSPKCYQHNPGRGHPESAKRLRAIVAELNSWNHAQSRCWQFVEPEKARIEDVNLVHDTDYIGFVERVSRCGGGTLDSGDTVVSAGSFESALYAVGGALEAVKLVTQKWFRNAFALVRPPGHHAEKAKALGFCLFNNVAIAANYLLRNQSYKRILILDMDAHHGNGTQKTFYTTSKALYISLHEDPRGFPGTGFADETGEGDGLGYNVNIPLPFRTGDFVYFRALQEIVIPIALEYKPQFILVSAGLDGHYADPVGNLSLSAFAYQQIYRALTELASETCEGKLVLVLEGGYSPKSLGKLAALAIAEMSGIPMWADDRIPERSDRLRGQGEKILQKVKHVQGSFWNIG